MSLEKNPSTGKVLELFGPTVEFLTLPQDAQSDFCVPARHLCSSSLSCRYRGFYHHPWRDRRIETRRDEGYKWIKAKTGNYNHVPSNARHAWRNVSNKPTLVHIITTKKLGHFFEETGRPETNTPQLSL